MKRLFVHGLQIEFEFGILWRKTIEIGEKWPEQGRKPTAYSTHSIYDAKPRIRTRATLEGGENSEQGANPTPLRYGKNKQTKPTGSLIFVRGHGVLREANCFPRGKEQIMSAEKYKVII